MQQARKFGYLLPASGALLALVLLQISSVEADDLYGSYLIKSRDISDLNEALEIMRQFTPPRVSSEVRCKKYALVLSSYYKDQSMDQFKLAKMASDNNLDNNAFRRITMDLLRDLYISAINQLFEQNLGEPCVELIGCLRDIFYNRDAKARAYLNRKQLKRAVDQYTSISSQSINFLLDQGSRHPSVTWEELERPVQLAAVRLFMGDEANAKAHFSAPDEAAHHSVAPLSEQDQPKQVAEHKEALPDVDHHEESPQVDDKRESLQEEQVVPMEQANNAEHLAKSLMNGFYADSERLHEQLPEELRELTKQLNHLLHLLHQKLPMAARLSDRCEAYSKLIGAEPSHLGPPVVDQILKETSETVSRNPLAAGVDRRFLPEPNMRENFLFTISVYPRNYVGDGLWMNLIDCVSLWKDDDEHVRQFMTDSRHFLYSQLDPFINHDTARPAPGGAPAQFALPPPPPATINNQS